jgi:hypothetical protein
MAKRSATELDTLADRVEQWADDVDPADLREIPIEDLRAITSLVATLQEVETALSSAVARARADGYSWAHIGTALGVSKQAAQQRYGEPATP